MLLPGNKLGLQAVQVGDSPIQTLLCQGVELNFCDIQPTAMLGGIMDFQTFRQSQRGLRREGFIQRRDRVGIQVVHDKPDSRDLGIMHLQQFPDLQGPVFLGTPLRGMDMTPVRQGLCENEDAAHAVSYVLVILFSRLARFHRNGLELFA